MYTNDNTGFDISNNSFSIAYQLNQILNEGDSFEFDDSLNSEDVLGFDSVEEFAEFWESVIDSEAEDLGISDLTSQNTATRNMSFDLSPVYDSRLRVDVQQEINGDDPIEILNVTSSLQGLTSFWEWTQNDNYDITIYENSNELVLTLTGEMKIGIIINGYGFYYTGTYTIRLEFNLTNGALINGWIIIIE